MRSLLIIFALVFSITAYANNIIDIKFYSASGDQYRTTTLFHDLEKHYGKEYKVDKVFLIQTPSLSNKKYIQQINNLNSLGHEEFLVIYVVASFDEVYKHGYHTNIETAKKLLGSKPTFKVLLLDSKGNLLKQSETPLSAQELRQWFGG